MPLLHLPDDGCQGQKQPVAAGYIVKIKCLLATQEQFRYSLPFGALYPKIELFLLQICYQGIYRLVGLTQDVGFILVLL